jgi:hypothetical protein
LTIEKIVAFAPMPSESVDTASIVNAGERRRPRRATVKSPSTGTMISNWSTMVFLSLKRRE